MLLVSFAALQLTLVSGGPGCPMPTAGSGASGALPSAAGGAGMAEMDMGAPETAASDAAAATAPTTPHSAPCDESAAPVTCPTMAPCLFAALPPLAQVATTATVAVPSGTVALHVLMPPSVSAAPSSPLLERSPDEQRLRVASATHPVGALVRPRAISPVSPAAALTGSVHAATPPLA